MKNLKKFKIVSKSQLIDEKEGPKIALFSERSVSEREIGEIKRV